MTDDIATLKKKIRHLRTRLMHGHAALLGILGHSLDGMVILDKEKNVVYSNYPAIRLFDRSIADLLEVPLHLHVGKTDLFASKQRITEIKISHADGRISIAEVFLLDIEWNNKPAHVVTFRDITERKRAEKTLE